MRTWLALLASAAISGGVASLWLGAYDISATDQHLAPTYWLLDTAMRRSVKARAMQIEVPPLGDPVQVAEGLRHFRDLCAPCHGAPGVAPAAYALGMTPTPANLVHTAREWRPAELFWTIRHGIKMTGMPAWAYRLSDREIWSIVAFMGTLPALSPQDYATRAGTAADTGRQDRPDAPDAPDAARGRRAIQQYACVTCHEIPGVVGANAPVGPPLAGMATRAFIAGVLPSTPENLVRWLRSPHEVSPRNAMPDLGVSDTDARDIAAYLLTLR